MRPAADAKGLLLTADLSRDPILVKGDAQRLQQVVWNLVANAIKFTPRGGRVDVVLREADGAVTLFVHDTGDGIEPDFLPYVFERFRQGDGSVSRLYGGLGLGLAIVRHLVELHGGSVRAESAGAGQGATFIVSLPRMMAAPADAAYPVQA
jgi:signal transduction histidine kinase